MVKTLKYLLFPDAILDFHKMHDNNWDEVPSIK